MTRPALAGMVTLAVMAAACYLVPEFIHLAPGVHGAIKDADLPLGAPGHWLGTDPVGNDELARLLAGGQVSIRTAAASNLAGFVIGGIVGAFSGMRSGIVDSVITLAFDGLLAFPSLVLALVVSAYLGPGEWPVIGAISLFSVPAYGRLARAQTLLLRQADFVVAARLAGSSELRTVWTHIGPNLFSRLLAFTTVGFPVAILFESSLSYLGLGVRPPAASWGNMIAEGQEYVISDPRLVIIPSIALLGVVMATTLAAGSTPAPGPVAG